MIAVLVVIVSLLGEPPAVLSKIVPPSVCEMIGHQYAERIAPLKNVASVQWRCITVSGPSAPERDA